MSVLPEKKPSKKEQILNDLAGQNKIEFPQEFYDKLIILPKEQLVAKIILLSATLQQFLNSIENECKIIETGIKQ